MLNSSEVHGLLDYAPDTGVFRWKVSRGGKAKHGTIAGSFDSKGYSQIKINGSLYLAHRIAWLYVNGEWPEKHIDHIDRNPKNNAIENLRLCTHAQNHQNTGVRRDNSSGITGVSFLKASGKWLAYINVDGKRIRLGLFNTADEAAIARSAGKSKHHAFGSERGVVWADDGRMAA